jgi:competence protein ComEC
VASIELATDTEDRQIPGDGSVRLTVRWPQQSQVQALPRGFACGERIRAVVRLLPPEEYRDPGAWSRTDYLLDQGITSSGSVILDRVEDLGSEQARSPHCRLASLQHASGARLLALPAAMRRLPAALRLGEDDAVMLAAMTTGDRTYLTHSLRVGFERTGSFHMLVVSVFISQLLQDVFSGSLGECICPARQPR